MHRSLFWMTTLAASVAFGITAHASELIRDPQGFAVFGTLAAHPDGRAFNGKLQTNCATAHQKEISDMLGNRIACHRHRIVVEDYLGNSLVLANGHAHAESFLGDRYELEMAGFPGVAPIQPLAPVMDIPTTPPQWRKGYSDWLHENSVEVQAPGSHVAIEGDDVHVQAPGSAVSITGGAVHVQTEED